ncbi:hypothetical protein [Blastococcus sp. SYSU DS0533]
MPYKLRESAQPAYYAIKAQQRSIGGVAQAIGVPYIHLRNTLYGRVTPSPVVRERLPRLLGLRLEDLFDAGTLARKYQPKYGPKR